MHYRSSEGRSAQEIVQVFKDTFTASEGAEEGALIGSLAADMLDSTPDADLFVFIAEDGDAIAGAILLSRITYEQDPRRVFILSPVAVLPGQQKQGVGQGLILHGLNALREMGVDYVLTYGDPDYYSRVGFAQITEDFAKAPLPLSQPIGWLGQSLSATDQAPLIGPSRCVPALDKPDMW